MRWVDILGYAHQYQINEDGEVRWFKDRARITMHRADGYYYRYEDKERGQHG